MKHCGTNNIETERLLLRRFVIEDADAMFRNWTGDPEVNKYLTWPLHTSVADSKEVLGKWISSYSNNDFYQWAIAFKDKPQEPIGSISCVGINEDVSIVDIGYCIGKNWWHKGITSEALKAVIDFFFDEVEVNRIECCHDTRNPHSGMVMKKCGMKYEGTMRSQQRNNQGICDVCWYAMLKSDRTN